MIKNLVPKPWKIIPQLFNLNLNCEIEKIKIDFENVKSDCLNIIEAENFKNHSGGAFSGSGWGAIGLITYGGDPYRDYVDKKLELKPTRLLEQCPNIIKLLKLIPGKKDRVRLMEVKPGTKVFWHYDNNETIDDLNHNQNIRLHLPIVTSKDIILLFCHQKANWPEGKLFYGDFSFPHSIFNPSNINRIHLVIDVEINQEIIDLFPKSFISDRKKRNFVKKLCQRSCNLYRKLKLIEN